jgi:acyl-CoA thioesterase FadM
VALISKKDRKITRVPDEWKRKYASGAVQNERLVVPTDAIPTGPNKTVTRYDMRVRWNDTDGYKHTNYLSYIKFCFDAAQDAVVSGKYSAFHGDILRYNVKAIEVAYKAETRANDQLTVLSWEDDDDPYKLHFSMQKDDGTVAFQSRIEFYRNR